MKARNYDEIYQKILNEKNPTLDNLQKRNATWILLTLALSIIFLLKYSIILQNSIVTMGIITAIILSLAFAITAAIKYKKVYKKTVVTRFVKLYCETLDYDGASGITASEYDRANYREHYDRYVSEDLIYGNVDGEFDIRMSEVRTEREEVTTDANGNTQVQYVTVFQGIFGYINLKDISLSEFEVTLNKLFGKYNKNRIEVDSAEFEKDYDLYSAEKIQTMQVFTSDLIERFNDLKKNLNRPIQIKSLDKVLYFRISSGNAFEAPIFGKTINYNSMNRDFKLIDEPLMLISKMLENAKSVQ